MRMCSIVWKVNVGVVTGIEDEDRELRKNEEYKSIPVTLLTVYDYSVASAYLSAKRYILPPLIGWNSYQPSENDFVSTSPRLLPSQS